MTHEEYQDTLTKSRFSIEDAHMCLSKDYSLLLFTR
jgi:hypothetical protein